MSADAQDIRKHVKVYLFVFGTLAALTLVTVAVSYLHLAVRPAVVLALVIAGAKASLVAMFFMHLKGERKWVSYPLLLTAVFFLMLMLMPLSWYLNRLGVEIVH